MSLRLRLLIFFGFVLYFVVSYLALQWIVVRFLTPTILLLPGEANIPFLPSFIIIYISVYLFPLAIVFFIESEIAFKKAVKAFLIASFVHYFIFLILPVKNVIRPEFYAGSVGLLEKLIHLFYQIDAPYNCFPSIHVSFAFLTYYCVTRVRPDLNLVLGVWTIAIAVSTVFVKQHYVLDVIAAMGLAYLLNRIMIKDVRS